jgi:Flp pilus assembly protein TadD
MKGITVIRSLTLAILAAACVAIAVPAAAQTKGSIKGRVLGPDGKLVVECDVIIENVSDKSVPPLILKTDQDGIFSSDSIPMGQYMVTGRKDKLIGSRKDPVTVHANDMMDTGDLKLHVGTADELKKYSEEDVAKIKAKNEKSAKFNTALEGANKAHAAGDFDGAIAKYNEIAGLDPTCVKCYLNIGNIYLDDKKDPDNAEKAYLKAIDLSQAPGTDVDAATKAGPYAKLAEIYNKEKKFDDAAKMSAKANEIQEAAGGAAGGGGGGSATALYNQGVALWNANKFPEAEAAFAKAVKVDPKMADAFYQLGMCQVNQNKLTEAKGNLQQYLKLAPTGPNAATAKAIVDSIK